MEQKLSGLGPKGWGLLCLSQSRQPWTAQPSSLRACQLVRQKTLQQLNNFLKRWRRFHLRDSDQEVTKIILVLLCLTETENTPQRLCVALQCIVCGNLCAPVCPALNVHVFLCVSSCIGFVDPGGGENNTAVSSLCVPGLISAAMKDAALPTISSLWWLSLPPCLSFSHSGICCVTLTSMYTHSNAHLHYKENWHVRKNPCPDFCVDRNQDCKSHFHACLSTAFRCELTTTAVSTCHGLCTMLIFLHVSYPVHVYMVMTWLRWRVWWWSYRQEGCQPVTTDLDWVSTFVRVKYFHGDFGTMSGRYLCW